MDFPGAPALEIVPVPSVHLLEALPNLKDKKGETVQ